MGKGIVHIYYESKNKKGKKIKWEPHGRQIQIKGVITKIRRGTFTNRLGRRVYGLKITYENKQRTYTRIVELPKGARNVKIFVRTTDIEPTAT